MGTCMSTEDIGLNGASMKAVQANSNTITDDILKATLPGHSLSSSVSLTFSCSNLINMDSRSKSDPYVVVFELKTKQ